MSSTRQRALRSPARVHRVLVGVGCALSMCAAATPALADGWHHDRQGAELVPGALLLSTSDYVPADITAGVTELPPGCAGSGCTAAIANGTYPDVFNNDQVDASFGVTSPIFLEELTPWGQVFNRIAVPTRDIVTSFSSKSDELNLSTNGQDVTFRARTGSVELERRGDSAVTSPSAGGRSPRPRQR